MRLTVERNAGCEQRDWLPKGVYYFQILGCTHVDIIPTVFQHGKGFLESAVLRLDVTVEPEHEEKKRGV